MNVSGFVKWIRTVVLAALVALSSAAPNGFVLTTVATVGGASVGVAAMPDAAWARRSFSGGYSRSPMRSFSSFSRRPSFGSGYRTPKFGTTHPSGISAGDRAINRSGSSSAFGRYASGSKIGRGKTGVGASTPRTRPSFATTSSATRWGGGTPTWYRNRGWTVPSYAYAMPRRFGVWDAVFLWFMLDHLGSPGHSAFFYNHQNDLGYQQWRANADQAAANNADLKQKLDTLDSDLAKREGEPRDPQYMPPDVPTQAAIVGAAKQSTPGGGSPWVVLLLLGVLFLLWRARRNRATRHPASRQSAAQSAQSTMSPWGSPCRKTKGPSVEPLRPVGSMLRRKMSKSRYAPSLFRVGMTLSIDSTPFLLVQGVSKVAAPIAGAGGLTSVTAVGSASTGNAAFTRLYMPNEAGFFQLHLDGEGKPDECRYFAVIDEVDPADEEEWGFWLDDGEGVIGWADFQTKDGKLYDRVWSPGPRHVRPVRFDESIESLDGTATRATRAMLYGATTGLSEPAPQTDYILVSAIEHEGRAWVRIAAGIDINPASLSLS